MNIRMNPNTIPPHSSSHKKSLIMFFFVIAMASTITIPISSGWKPIFDAIVKMLPFVRQAQITYYFYMYNIIGISSLCLLAVLAWNLLSRNRGHLTLSIPSLMLLLWMALQVLYCFIYTEFSTMLWQPVLLICVFFFFKQPEYRYRFVDIVIHFGVANALLTIAQFAYFEINGSIFSLIRLYRPPALFPDATTSAIYMSLTIAFVLFNRPFMRSRTILSLSTLVLGCLLNGSRNAIVLILIAVVLFGLRGKIGQWTAIFIILLLLGICVLLISDTLNAKFSEILTSFLFDKTRGTRREIAMTLFKENPIIGAGLDKYAAVASNYGFSSTVHNIYAMILCNYGIVGFMLFIVPLIIAIIRGYKKNRFAMCILIMVAVGAYVSGVETSLPIQIVWYYAYSIIYFPAQAESRAHQQRCVKQ